MPFYSEGFTPDPQSLPSGSGTSQMAPAPSLRFAAFQYLYSSTYGFLGVRAPPPPGTALQQWESSQWFSNARYDYTQSGAFLDISSGSPVDDIIESGTVRLLDWNNSMTDIQLSMRFVDKVQAVSAVRKYSVSVGHTYRVLKNSLKNTHALYR
ncbi:hypothetical protein M9H77_28372 [Catharanthus roseus]|uniref:Uncharacterized protein n=1 Tax=Catharanthus roseus TaxID=4058 RepID=A0ACC0AHF1_CATRO|nr:hypothetical protein M9H77_28372 [Catharanthus roseus]